MTEKNYRVAFSLNYRGTIEVQAENENEARRKAEESNLIDDMVADGGMQLKIDEVEEAS